MSTTLTGLRIWDGGGFVDADGLRFDENGIEAIGDAADLDRADRVIDCTGLTAIPGLIDAHVHLELNPDEKDPPAGGRDAEELGRRMEERASAMVQAGITTARDLGGGAWFEVALRDRIAAGGLPGPRMICSGQPITCIGGHCHFWGGEAGDLAAAKTVLARQVAHRVDLIKVMATGGRLTKGTDPQKPQFDIATLEGIVAEARVHDLPVAAHCHGAEGIRVAAEAGVATIEHCSWVGESGWASDFRPEIADLIAERGIWVSPTVNRGWQRMLDNKTGTVLGRVRNAYREMLDRGIPFVASTDAGIPGVYHQDLPRALAVFAQIAELSGEQTLHSATAASAKALGVSHVTGRLAQGLAADVLLVHGDPLEDLSVLAEPAAVWACGRDIRLPH